MALLLHCKNAAKVVIFFGILLVAEHSLEACLPAGGRGRVGYGKGLCHSGHCEHESRSQRDESGALCPGSNEMMAPL